MKNCKTERKLLPAEDQKGLIAEQRLITMALLAGGVAHQINNPLSFIQSNLHTLFIYVKVLIEGADRMLKMMALLGDTENSARAEFVEIIDWLKNSRLDYIREDIASLIDETLEGGARIASIVGTLQVFDRAELIRKADEECLKEVIPSLIEGFRCGAPPGVSVSTELGGLNEDIRVNRRLLTIALENIFQNAIDAVGENGEIHVRLFNNDSLICIQVIDSGDGIPLANMNKVFDPFFTTRGNPRKAGLGLTVAQFLVQAHGGQIEISSGSGRGSSVMILLPMDLQYLSSSCTGC